MADRKKTKSPAKSETGSAEKLVAGSESQSAPQRTTDNGQRTTEPVSGAASEPKAPELTVPRARPVRKKSRATPRAKKSTSTGRPGPAIDQRQEAPVERAAKSAEQKSGSDTETPIISALDRVEDAALTIIEKVSTAAVRRVAAAGDRLQETARPGFEIMSAMAGDESSDEKTSGTRDQFIDSGEQGAESHELETLSVKGRGPEPPTADKPSNVKAHEAREPEPGFSILTDLDLHLFNEGTHHRLFDKLGAHPMNVNGVDGTHFAVWAPSARYVSVVGDFNGWNAGTNPLSIRAMSGIWEGFIEGVAKGALYKFNITSPNGYSVKKADPFGFFQESAPRTASIVWKFEHEWGDQKWMKDRAKKNSLDAPQSIYEVHLGSWRRGSDGRSLTYREIAPQLAEYVKQMGFTHVEFMPLMEHPFYGSWGYQVTGFFAPTSRYGSPDDLMYLVDVLHQNDIGVILDWVPSHFPTDEFALSYFDGTHLFEHEDPRQGYHMDWNSLIFNYGRHEVRSFLLSSAIFWLEQFHADGLRVDAVASMLYRDYSRKQGEWIPNQYGGRENLEAIEFLRTLNHDIYTVAPDVQTIAEESTSFPLVSRPTYVGGLGFGMKWDMGWMHDTLEYFSHDPIHRKFHHNSLTFRMMYAFSENFVLPLSHDEVVHLKGSLLSKMPGDDWQKFANLRLLFAYMFAQPGKKLIFMGGEFGQWGEWNHDQSLDWHLLQNAPHGGLQKFVADLNKLYRGMPAMYQGDIDPAGFEWIDCNDSEQSVVSLMRKSKDDSPPVVAVFNFTPLARHNYQIGVDHGGWWKEILNSDATEFGGSGVGNLGRVESAPVWKHNRRYALNLTLPPLGAVFLMPEETGKTEETGLELAESWKAVVAEKPAAKAPAAQKPKKSTPAKKRPN